MASAYRALTAADCERTPGILTSLSIDQVYDNTFAVVSDSVGLLKIILNFQRTENKDGEFRLSP